MKVLRIEIKRTYKILSDFSEHNFIAHPSVLRNTQSAKWQVTELHKQASTLDGTGYFLYTTSPRLLLSKDNGGKS
jgi:hypothetical protein